MMCNGVIGGPMLYKTPPYRSSKIFLTRFFWRLRNHTFDGHISGLDQDRDNLKPLLPTKSPTPYRLVPVPCMSRDHTTSGLAFLAFLSHTNRRKRGHNDVFGRGTWARWGKNGASYWGSRRCPRRLRSRRVCRSFILDSVFFSFCELGARYMQSIFCCRAIRAKLRSRLASAACKLGSQKSSTL